MSPFDRSLAARFGHVPASKRTFREQPGQAEPRARARGQGRE